MSTLSKTHRPILSRPWFAAFAMTIGASAMALGAYNAENPPAFATRNLRPAPTPIQANVVRQVVLSPEPAQLDTPTIVLAEVRITGTATRRPTPKVQRTDTCVEGWRSLAMGPAARQVRELCK